MSPAARRTARKTTRKKTGGARRTTARKSTSRRAPSRKTARRSSGGSLGPLSTSLDSLEKRVKKATANLDGDARKALREVQTHVSNARKSLTKAVRSSSSGGARKK